MLIRNTCILSYPAHQNYRKDSSEKFINDNKLCTVKFSWQKSAAAFSVSKADVNKVCKYILSQPKHHRKVTFAEEYESFMKFYQMTLKPVK